MLKKLFLTITPGLLLAGLAAGITTPAQAQVGFEVGPRGPRIYDRTYERPMVRERRVIRRERDCRTVVERRVNRFGERVVRRTRVCD